MLNDVMPHGLQAELEALFQVFDADGDGRISPQEVERSLANLEEAIPAAEAGSLRDLVQTQGELRADQFFNWAQGQGCFDLISNLRELFDLIDGDGSGSLSPEEIGVMLELLDRSATPERISAFMAAHDRDASGTISLAEFIQLLGDQGGIRISLADLKRLKKTFIQYSRAALDQRIGLVEVDCDLGAGIPGAGSGIELLKQAAMRQEALRQLTASLVAEISDSRQPIQARAADAAGACTTPHARHIETIGAVMAEAARLVCDARRRDLFPVVLAGDHSTAAGTIAGLRRAHPGSRIGVVWIDAHADIHSPFTTPSGNMHGMPLAIATRHDNRAQAIQEPDAATLGLWRDCQDLAGEGEAAIGLGDLIYVAVRDAEPAELATLAAHNIPIVTTEEVRRVGPEAAAAQCLEHLAACDLIYVSFDVDSMDATICKGTGTPVPGGLWADEARRINATLLADPRVVCWEICEINPHLDSLNTLAEVSLGVYQSVLDVLQRRL
jgi:arginase